MTRMLKAGRRTLTDVATLAGVSAATVSRALTRPSMVNAKTKARVAEAVASLGYSPTGAARALASGRTMTIGAVVPTLDSAIFANALQAMQAELSRGGYMLLIASHDGNAAAEFEAIRALFARGVDGLMLVGAERSAGARQLIASCGVPIVLTWCGDEAFASVTIDNRRAGRLAAEHLLSLGHRRIGMVTGPLQFNDRQRARLDGARAALAARGVHLPESLVTEQPLSLAGGRSGCAKLLALDERPTAIIGGIDLLAIGCIEEAHARNIRVPANLSVVGIDDLDMSAHLTPSLTTVHVPTARIGASAARALVEQINGRRVQMEQELPIELAVRASSAAPSGMPRGRRIAGVVGRRRNPR